MNETVSIIVPIYNAEKYLIRCLESIITQTYTNIEVILINDGSNDKSLNIIKEYANRDSRIVIIDKKNEGVSVARNVGILNAKGKYICFVDADDYIDKNMIKKMKFSIDKENVDLVRVNYYKIASDGRKFKGNLECYANKTFNKDRKNELIEGIISGKLTAFVYLLMIKKEKIINMFPVGIPYMEDTIFCIDLFLNCDSIYFLDDALYYYILNESSATQNPKNLKRNINALLSVKKIISEILLKYDIKDKKTLELLNNTLARQILDFIYLIYYNKEDYIEIIKNNGIKEFLLQSDKISLPIYNRLAQNFIIKGKTLKLRALFFMRKHANRILNKNN